MSSIKNKNGQFTDQVLNTLEMLQITAKIWYFEATICHKDPN